MKHSRGGYVRGCRCDVCVEANRDYQRDYLRKRVGAGVVDAHGRVLIREHLTREEKA